MKHTILLPTYNEAENVEKIIFRIFDLQPDIYVMVIDDNSPDGTGKIVESLMKKFPHLLLLSRAGKEGLGRAYIHGFKEVMKDPLATHVVMMDADMSHDPKYLKEMLIRSRVYDVVIGSRYIRGGTTIGWELWRRVLSFGGNLYCRTITGMPIRDYTGGFNIISLNLLRKINFDSMDMSGYAFIMELKYLMYKNGGTFTEVPIVFVNRTGGESKISNHIISEGVVAPWKMRFKKDEVKEGTPACSLCGSSHVRYSSKKNGHILYKCHDCQFLFVHPLPQSIDVYNETYFSGAEQGFGYVDYDTDKEPMRPTFEVYLDKIGKLGVTSGKLLDIGAATGFFMELAQKRGFDVVGVEISDFAAQKGRNKGLNIITGVLESSNFPAESFDVITMCDVLEHVSHPKEFLIEARRILKSNGLILINTPDADSAVSNILGSKWHLIVPPEHLHYFSPQNLSTHFSSIGFSVPVNTTIGKRFTLQYIFKMLYKWQKFSLWNTLKHFFSKKPFSGVYIPINLRDNFFMIVRKKII